jgi:predicted kinase
VGLVSELGEDASGLAGGLVQQASLLHLGSDDLRQPLVARQPEDIIDMVLFVSSII